MKIARPLPAVGIGYRSAIGDWTRENLAHFDMLEITVDHYLSSGECGPGFSIWWAKL